jgi:1-acyl-sn-glycerol-3-phosphate acyltransferase
MKMFSCDYNDLVNPKAKKLEEATRFTGSVQIGGVDVDMKRSFTEIYSSTPEPKIPVCITFFWKVFRAKAATAKLTVSDWQNEKEPGAPIGQEQTFNFVEIQPYRE